MNTRKNHINYVPFMVMSFMATLVIALIPGMAFATGIGLTLPAAGDFGYEFYNIAVNQILGGPIGFVGGVVAIVMGAAAAIQQRVMLAIPSVLGGVALLNAQNMTNTLAATLF